MNLAPRAPRSPHRPAAAALALAALLALAGCESIDQPATPVRDLRGPSGPPRAQPNRPPEAPRDGASGQQESGGPDPQRRAQVRLELGASYYQSGQHALAIEELRQALAVDANYAPAWGMLGLVYMELGENARAEESFQRALKLDPEDSELLNNYGWYLCQTGRPREAIAQFQTALKNPLYATPSRVLHNAGICSLRAGDEAAAEQYFQRSFQLDARNPVAMFHLGEILLKRGDLERAKFHAQRLLSLYPPSAETLWLAIRIDRRVGDRDSVASLTSQLRRQFPGSREAGLLQRGAFGD